MYCVALRGECIQTTLLLKVQLHVALHQKRLKTTTVRRENLYKIYYKQTHSSEEFLNVCEVKGLAANGLRF